MKEGEKKFGSKYNLPIPRPPEITEKVSPFKRECPALPTMKFLDFSTLWVLCPPGLGFEYGHGSGSTDLIESGSETPATLLALLNKFYSNLLCRRLF